MTFRISWAWTLWLAFLVLFAVPNQAHAGRRGIILISYGDTIEELGGIQSDRLALAFPENKVGNLNLHVGFKYSYFGLFFLDLWNWGGEYCVYVDRTYESITPAQAALLMGIAPGELEKPLNYRFPCLLCLCGIGFGLNLILKRNGGAQRSSAISSLPVRRGKPQVSPALAALAQRKVTSSPMAPTPPPPIDPVVPAASLPLPEPAAAWPPVPPPVVTPPPVPVPPVAPPAIPAAWAMPAQAG